MYQLQEEASDNAWMSVVDAWHDSSLLRWLERHKPDLAEQVKLLGGIDQQPMTQVRQEALAGILFENTQWPLGVLNAMNKPEHIRSMDCVKAMDEAGWLSLENYIELRKQLNDLLKKTKKLEELPLESMENVQQKSQDLYENAYRITLIGGFMSGKSTIFNVMCDGREISPRGYLAACLITARNISDEDVEEYVIVRWKTDAELLKLISGIIMDGLKKRMEKRFDGYWENLSILFGEKKLENYPEFKPLRLSADEDIKILKEIIDEEYRDYKKNPDVYSQKTPARDVFLCMAMIIVDMYKNASITELRTHGDTKLTMNEYGNYIVYPGSSWAIHWQKYFFDDREAGKLKPAYLVFPFVAEVDCYIHSKNLERLGCVVTECPGLFTSAWGTEVAEKKLKEADMNVYLFSGETPATQQDKNALLYIKKIDADEKLFCIFNSKEMRKSKLSRKKAIMYAYENQKWLRDNAILPIWGRVFVCNAGLMLSIMQYDMDKICNNSWGRFAADEWIDDPDMHCPTEVRWELGNFIADSYKSYTEMQFVDGVDLKKESSLGTIFEFIERYILKNIAYAVLIECGAKKILNNIVNRHKTYLLEKIDDAYRKKHKLESEYVKRKSKLEAIIKDFNSILKERIHGLDSLAIIENFRQVVFVERISAITKQISDALAQDIIKNNLYYVRGARFDGNQNFIKERVEKIFIEAFDKDIKQSVQSWINKMFINEDAVIKKQLSEMIENIDIDLNERKMNIKKITLGVFSDSIDEVLPERIEAPSECLKLSEDIISSTLETIAGIVSNILSDFIVSIIRSIENFISKNAEVMFVILASIALLFSLNKLYLSLDNSIPWISKKLSEKLEHKINEIMQSTDVINTINTEGQRIVSKIMANIHELFYVRTGLKEFEAKENQYLEQIQEKIREIDFFIQKKNIILNEYVEPLINEFDLYIQKNVLLLREKQNQVCY